MTRSTLAGLALFHLMLSLLIPASASADLIRTYAGNGVGSYSGDGGPATEASLYYPQKAAPDSFGNLFIADSTNVRVRKVDVNGVITTVAGNGTYSYYGPNGDGGPATEAPLADTMDVAVDRFGNIYIAGYNDQRIRKVDTNGIITTVAGNGTYGFSGDGGPATEANLAVPSGVAVDNAGNIYIADYLNARIRKVDVDGIITTVAGNGTFGYSGDGGPATQASLYGAYDVAVDNIGNIYIADVSAIRVRKVDVNGLITTVAGNGTGGYSGDGGPATEAGLDNPYGVSVDDRGNIYISASPGGRIRKVNANGIITTVAGNGGAGYSGDGGPATQATLGFPTGAEADSLGNLYIADSHNHRIRRVSQFPEVISNVPADGAVNVPLNQTITITFSEDILVIAPESNILLYDQKRFLPVGRTLSVNGNTLIVTPVGLTKNTSYSVTIPSFSIQDMDGNEMNADEIFFFTTVKK